MLVSHPLHDIQRPSKHGTTLNYFIFSLAYTWDHTAHRGHTRTYVKIHCENQYFFFLSWFEKFNYCVWKLYRWNGVHAKENFIRTDIEGEKIHFVTHTAHQAVFSRKTSQWMQTPVSAFAQNALELLSPSCTLSCIVSENHCMTMTWRLILSGKWKNLSKFSLNNNKYIEYVLRV